MGTTTAGYPYPEGTDKVIDGDNAIQALAEALDGPVGAAGSVAVLAPAAGVGSATVTFPAGLFTTTPRVVVSAVTSRPDNRSAGMGSLSAASCTIYVYSAVSEGTVSVSWIARADSPAAVLLEEAAAADASATCHTAGCGNADIPIPYTSTWTDEETGETHTVDEVVCGVCSQPITDLTS